MYYFKIPTIFIMRNVSAELINDCILFRCIPVFSVSLLFNKLALRTLRTHYKKEPQCVLCIVVSLCMKTDSISATCNKEQSNEIKTNTE